MSEQYDAAALAVALICVWVAVMVARWRAER